MKTIVFLSAIGLWVLSGCGQSSAHMPVVKARGESTPSVDSNALRLAQKYRASITEFIDSTFTPGRFNGSILVAKDGNILFEEYRGYTNPRQKKDSITPNTPFHLASVSKTVTATAILQLCQEGKLRLADSVSKYLAGFPGEGVTIRSLLNHRSGLPNYVHYMERLGWDKHRFVHNQDVLDFLIARQKEIDIGPADRHFSYSNTNYALLALIIEKVSGLSYRQYLQQKIFQPLGMAHTYVFSREDSASALPSYYASGRPYPFDFLDYVVGDKNIYSTVHDIFLFDDALNNGKLLRSDILDSAYKPYSFEKPGTHNYGLGWRMYLLKNGKKLIYHNGWWHGNRTAFYRLTDEHAVIIAFSNNDYKKVYNIKKLSDLFGNYLQTDQPQDDDENAVVVNRPSPRHHKHHRPVQRSVQKKAISQSLAAKK